jgi:uncharacterized lipoprotein YbaY
MAGMGNLRVIAVATLGMSLVAACGASRAPVPTPAPVPAPSRAVSQSPAASPSATGAVTASAAWATAEGAELSGSTALLDVAATGPRDA